MTEEEAAAAGEMMKKFAVYAPHFKGPISPEESVKAVMEVIAHADINKGYAGAFVSHFGNKQWL